MGPEGAATFAAYRAAFADGRVAKDERVVLFNCATGLKYPMPPADRRLDRTKAIDYAALCRSVVKPGLPSVDSAF